MGLEEIINKILTTRNDLNREQILKMVKTKKMETGNFLTDQTAARIVASELGVEISKKQFSLKIQIKDIITGLNDVSLSGQVVTVYPSRTFKRRDWTDGKLGSIVVSDKTGTIRVVLWDQKADLIDKGKIQRDQKITVSHAYVRQGQDGNPELHLGDKGKVKVFDETPKLLAEITQEGGPITVEGTVSTKPQLREVTTKRNEKVMVASFELTDKSGKMMVTTWRNIAQTVNDLPEGTRIKLRNVYAKIGYEKNMELSSRYSTVIEVLSQT